MPADSDDGLHNLSIVFTPSTICISVLLQMVSVLLCKCLFFSANGICSSTNGICYSYFQIVKSCIYKGNWNRLHICVKMSMKLPQADALSTPQTLPSTDPSPSTSEYRTSLDVLVAKSLAWAHVWNPRSLENDWLAVYQYTLDDLLVRGVPKSDN